MGFQSLFAKSRIAAASVAAVLLIASVQKDVLLLITAKEDWVRAAAVVNRAAGDGYCLEMPSATQNLALYRLFVPDAKWNVCAAVTAPARVALVTNLYTTGAEMREARARLTSEGYSVRETLEAGGTTIGLMQR